MSAPAGPTLPADRDADTIPDARDTCPDEPEDLDRFEDEDGCADRDNDGDGIPDAHEFIAGRWTNCDFLEIEGDVDQDCRDLPEDFDGASDLDGCPDMVLCEPPPPLLELRYRKPGKLSAAELAQLDAIVPRLHTEPALRVWIDAHVDRQRDPMAAKRITQQLAEAVLEALVERDITRERLEPRGMGHEIPVAYDDAKGRQRNRRVELHVHDGCACVRPCRQRLLCR